MSTNLKAKVYPTSLLIFFKNVSLSFSFPTIVVVRLGIFFSMINYVPLFFLDLIDRSRTVDT